MIEPVTARPASPPATKDKTASGSGMPLPRDALVKATRNSGIPRRGPQKAPPTARAWPPSRHPPFVGCFVDEAGVVHPLPCFLLVPSEHANRNGHSYYFVAHDIDPNTGETFNGILSSWEQSKPHHHGVKG